MAPAPRTRVQRSVTITGPGSGPTAGELRDALNADPALPDSAQLTISVDRGDQRDPGSWTIKASFDPREI